jgi:hypothetical protein
MHCIHAGLSSDLYESVSKENDAEELAAVCSRLVRLFIKGKGRGGIQLVNGNTITWTSLLS